MATEFELLTARILVLVELVRGSASGSEVAEAIKQAQQCYRELEAKYADAVEENLRLRALLRPAQIAAAARDAAAASEGRE